MPIPIANGHISRVKHFNSNFRPSGRPTSHASFGSGRSTEDGFQHRPVETHTPVKDRLRKILWPQHIAENQVAKGMSSKMRQHIFTVKMATLRLTGSELILKNVEDLTLIIDENKLPQVPRMLERILVEKLRVVCKESPGLYSKN